MEDGLGQDGVVGTNELRQRLPQRPDIPQRAGSEATAKKVVVDLNSAEEHADKAEKDKKTFGRTPDGTVFTVPQTHDMVSQLLSPTQPKNLSDLVVLSVLALHAAALYFLPTSVAVPFFALVYIFWRFSYNGGIGFLLYEQSNYNSIINWVKKTRIFENPSAGKNPHPQFYAILRREMETKIPKDYKFETAPLEYNTWLLFRRVVDLILMCDFVSYCCFAIACGGTPKSEHAVMTALRWAAGIGLVLFNLWVKLDAHRVVKDFAWYWGDFFFLIDQELTFDGVFEMAPHPMYSIGYAGYYGITLMAASYKVLFISIFAHAAQFAFLAFVENPHIDKIYNPPAPRAHVSDERQDPNASPHEQPTYGDDKWSPAVTGGATTYVRDIIGFENLDLHRIVDVATILMQLYIWTFALLTPSTPLYQTFFVINAGIWRLWYSIGIGYILDRQSRKKNWTRHFIKYGETTREAWRQWKSIYHLSMTICYTSFAVASYKMYNLPPDWEYGMVALRHVIGLALIALQLWTVISIYESLGEFGWFFGDFFFERGPKLTYSGIYRFLNNPERVIGLAGVWGMAIITWSKAVFFLAVLSHGLTLCFIQFVERPHMQQRYGQRLRQHSGLSRSFKKSLPSSLQKWQDSVDRAIEDTADVVEDFFESARPRLSAGVDAIVKDTKAALRVYPSAVNVRRKSSELHGIDPHAYSIVLEGTSSPSQPHPSKISGREGELARMPSFRGSQHQPVNIEYGQPIRVKWTAPINHSKEDWVGLYMVADNSSKEVTRVASQGRWIATSQGVYDSTRAEQGQIVADKQVIEWSESGEGKPLVTGEMEFAGDKLWWTTGTFEFRYHHNGRHGVMAASAPFEIQIPKFEEDNTELDAGGSLCAAVEQVLLPVVRNCFDRDPEIAPRNGDEAFGALVEREGKFAKRVVYAILHMFGIELAPSVVKSDGNVKNLAWRICNAKHVLAPYSMSTSKGRSTPTEMTD